MNNKKSGFSYDKKVWIWKNISFQNKIAKNHGITHLLQIETSIYYYYFQFVLYIILH